MHLVTLRSFRPATRIGKLIHAFVTWSRKSAKADGAVVGHEGKDVEIANSGTLPQTAGCRARGMHDIGVRQCS
jgi:hypothetical protein